MKSEIEYLEIEENEEWEKLINKVLTECFKTENMENYKLYISVTLTNPKNIKKLNNQYRNIDKETDVLSFPMFEKDEIQLISTQYREVLGDAMISIERVQAQAEEYEHSFERELSYMVVHSFYHLIGYDHMIEEEKAEMRKKEENVLELLKIIR